MRTSRGISVRHVRVGPLHFGPGVLSQADLRSLTIRVVVELIAA